jgi:transcriptional regulator with XRE-family HTH domain
MDPINDQLKEKFRDQEFLREYYRNAAFFRLADQVLAMRKQRGLTQKELAEKVGTTQAVISRLENVSVKPSLDTIVRIAEALDAVVEVQLKPLEYLKPFGEDDEECPEVSQDKQETLKSILLYERSKPAKQEVAYLISIEQVPFTLSGKPTLTPVGRNKKDIEFA